MVAPVRFVSSAASYLRRLWAWITLQPGSRPRRTAGKLLQIAARFVLARPLLARFLGPLLTNLPGLKRRIFFHFPAHPDKRLESLNGISSALQYCPFSSLRINLNKFNSLNVQRRY